MSRPSVFEYTIIRVVPRVERGECLNVGVVLFCRGQRFLAARIHLDAARLRAFAPTIDIDALREQLDHLQTVCVGGVAAGPIGELPQPERFRWIAAPRSTIIQMSATHTGLCADPEAALERLAERLVG